jgi:hypothetical protein
MKNTPLLVLASAALMLSMSPHTSAATAAAPPGAVREQLQVRSSHGKVLVRVTLQNQGAQPVYVPAAIAGSGTLSGPLFGIVDQADATPLLYIGKMVKRGPLGPDDYIRLAPHAVRHNTIDISSDYAFKDGTHRYRLTHEGSYLTALENIEAALPAPAASAEFTHTAP